MLTGKKIGAFFFGILVMSLAFTFFPLKTEALTINLNDGKEVITVNSFNSPTTQIDLKNNGILSVNNIKAIYNEDTSKGTSDIGAGGYYYVTDGKTYTIFSKGSPDIEGGAIRDNSKDALVGVIGIDGQYRSLKSPIPNTNVANQQAAVNTIAQATGDTSTDPYTTVMSKNNSDAAIKAQTDERLDVRRQIDAAKDAREQAINNDEDTTEVDAKIKALEEKWAVLAAKTNAAARSRIDPPQGDAEAIYCIGSDGKVGIRGVTLPTINFSGCFAMIGNIILKGAAWILWASAIIFDKTLDYTLGSGFKDIVEKSTFITVGWGMFRDISNLFFIFILLFISIGTILNNSKLGSKSLIPSILMAAVLINFSLFFTKVIIDASNIVTLQFYAQMNGDDISKAPTSGDATGIAAQFIRGLNLTTLYTIGSGQSASSGNGSAATQASDGKVSWLNSNSWNIMLVTFGGTILILITAFMFFAATILFFYRAIIFVFLMTTAPIAFMSKAIPSGHLNSLSGKWWSKLWSQALFAPAYMALTYLVILLMKSGPKGGNFAALFAGNTSVGVSTAISFIMIIGFMVMSLTAATSFGGYASSGVMSMGRKIAGWGKDTARGVARGATIGAAGVAARGVIGGTAYAAANSNTMRSIAARLPGGGIIKTGLDKVGAAKFGTKKGFEQAVNDRQKRREQVAEFASGSNTYRSQRWFEDGTKYSAKRAKYETNQKAAGTARKNASLGIKVDDKGNFLSASTPFTTAISRADARGFREAQQKYISELKKKGKSTVDKVTRKKAYLENIDDIIGSAEAKAELHDPSKPGVDHKEQSIDTTRLLALKKKINEGTFIAGGKLSAIQADIAASEAAIKVVGASAGEIAKESTKLNNLYKRKESLEEKVLTHLDSVDKLQQEPTT